MRFTYTAQDQKGGTFKGDLEAKGRQEAAELLLAKGLTPLSLTALEQELGRAPSRARFFLVSGPNIFDQIIITRHLGTILAAGTDLLSALSVIAQDAPKPFIRHMMSDVKSRVSAGESLANAFSAWKAYFNPIFLRLVEAGEASGNLAKILQDYSKELRQEYAFQRKVKGALFYPVILLTALSGMMLLMLSVVIPRLKQVFRATKITPPWYSRVMFTLSDVWRENMLVVVLLLAFTALIIFLVLRNPRVRRQAAAMLWHIPYLSQIQRNSTLFHFTKTLAGLIKAGFNLRQALVVAAEAIGQPYEKVLKNIAEEELSRGITLSASLRAHPALFPPLMVSLIATGEKSGELEGALNQMVEFYEEETIYALEQFVKLIEPALIVAVGIVVGVIAGSLISPIYKFIGRF